jgi:hypothetical protein
MSSSGCPETVYSIRVPKCAPTIRNLSVIKVLGDGSCFFHAILRAFNREYIEAGNNNERKALTRTMRDAVSMTLEEVDENGFTGYENLGNGSYKEFNDAVSNAVGNSYSLEALQDELKSDRPVDHAYTQHISDYFNLDIYLISEKTGDLYCLASEKELLYKGRNSIVILYSEGHYDIIGIRRKNVLGGEVIFDCLFHPTHLFIQLLSKRFDELVTPE